MPQRINQAQYKNSIAFRAFRSSALTLTNGEALGPLAFNATSYDTANSFNISTGRYVVPIAGYYAVGARFSVTNASSQRVRIDIFKNGAAVSRGVDNTAIYAGTTVVDQLYLEAGDIIDCRYTSIATNSIADPGTERTYFWGRYLSS